MFAGGSRATTGLPAGDPFALAIEGVEDQPGLRGGLVFLRRDSTRPGPGPLLVLVSDRARIIQILRRRRSGAIELLLPLECGLGKSQCCVGLIERCFFHGWIKGEEQLPGGNLLPALHGKILENAGERRTDVNKFTLDIALVAIVRCLIATGDKPNHAR